MFRTLFVVIGVKYGGRSDKQGKLQARMSNFRSILDEIIEINAFKYRASKTVGISLSKYKNLKGINRKMVAKKNLKRQCPYVYLA